MTWTFGHASKGEVATHILTDVLPNVLCYRIECRKMWAVVGSPISNYLACIYFAKSVRDKTWGFRVYTEDSPIPATNCPLEYLKMTAVVNPGWRDKVLKCRQ